MQLCLYSHAETRKRTLVHLRAETLAQKRSAVIGPKPVKGNAHRLQGDLIHFYQMSESVVTVECIVGRVRVTRDALSAALTQTISVAATDDETVDCCLPCSHYVKPGFHSNASDCV